MKIEDNIISEICFKSILDRNSNSRTLEKINADVEKLLGNTNKQIVDAGINKQRNRPLSFFIFNLYLLICLHKYIIIASFAMSEG